MTCIEVRDVEWVLQLHPILHFHAQNIMYISHQIVYNPITPGLKDHM